jgi:hypothetical protein
MFNEFSGSFIEQIEVKYVQEKALFLVFRENHRFSPKDAAVIEYFKEINRF